LKKYFSIILILITSCVEHKFFFKVSPVGNYKVEYNAHGDKKDLMDFDFTIPSNSQWEIHSTLFDDDVESYDYSARRLFKRNEPFPEYFYSDDTLYIESLLKHPINIQHSNWFFWETYSFHGQFVGREVVSKYPLVGELIKDTENPPDGWMKETLEYILTETLNRSDIEWNKRPIINAELRNWIKTDLQAESDSTLFEEIDYYKNLGLDIIMQPVSPNLFNEIDSIFKILEDELQITLDLIDDNFEFQLILPGKLETTNADSIIGDTLLWSFNIENYMNENYIMSAESGISYPDRKKYGIMCILTLMILCIGIISRKR